MLFGYGAGYATRPACVGANVKVCLDFENSAPNYDLFGVFRVYDIGFDKSDEYKELYVKIPSPIKTWV